MFKNASTVRTLTLPAVRTRMRRRLLVSYRVDPVVAASLVPAGFRPLLVEGSAVAGICAIALDAVRPSWCGPRVGFSSENATHRIAVEWDEPSGTRSGVFIFERASSSPLPVMFGGRAFPGVHRAAQFTTNDADGRVAIAMDDVFAVVAEPARDVTGSLFPTLEAASAFYQRGRIGWSRRHDGATLERLAFDTDDWRAEAAQVSHLRSSFFDALPAGSATFDHALLMRDLDVVMSRA